MAEITKQALKVDNNQSFPNNNNGAITPSILRAFNVNMIDSLVDEVGYTADSSSWNQQIDALEQFTASASGLTTGSLLVTASAAGNVITFTKGDTSTFNVTVATGSSGGDVTALNAFTASQLDINTGYNTFTQSANTSITSLNAATASYVTETESGSFLLTASFDNGTRNLTFTKGNNTTFNVNIPDVSGSAGDFVTTSSFNAYTQSNDQRVSSLESNSSSVNISITALNTFSASAQISINNLNAATSSYITSAQTSSMSVLSASFAISSSHAELADLATEATNAIYAQNTIVTGKNLEATQIIKGTPLYFTGSGTAGNVVGVYRADAGNPSRMPAGGVAGEAIDTGNEGIILLDGFINGVDTSAFASGDEVFVGVGGGYTNVAPTGSALIQHLGNVEKSAVNGSGVIQMMGEARALPNIQTGYAWVGDANGVPQAVATSSFGGGGTIDTGSFATTGSNTFTGDQTLIDNAGNFFTISDASGSLMLVAKGYTSASAHLSASSAGIGNIIFKTNNNTPDTIISGSSNIFTNASAPQVGLKRYIGGSNNIINTISLPQISGSMQFSPGINQNYIVGQINMRGPVSSSAWNIANNYNVGNISIGTTAASHAQGIVSGLNLSSNNILGILQIVANRTNTTQGFAVSGNQLLGTSTTINANSSSIQMNANLVGGSNTINNNTTGSSRVSAQGNAFNFTQNIMMGGNTITASGSNDPNDTGDVDYNANIYRSLILGNSNTIQLQGGISGSNSMVATSVIGNGLIVTGSSPNPQFAANQPGIFGSEFIGRFNAVDGNRALTAQTIFAVGTGTSTSNRKTGFLIDSGSNSYFEGVVNVSGSLFVNGVEIVSGSGGGTINTASFATTGSNSFNGNQIITGSLLVSDGLTLYTSSQISIGRFPADIGTNLRFGNSAMQSNVTGQSGIAIGLGTMQFVTSFSEAIAIGANTMANAVNPQSSIAIGGGAMQYSSGSNQSIAIGQSALALTTGSFNTAIGGGALSKNTAGGNNFAMGNNAMFENTTGNQNVAIGVGALYSNVSGSTNLAIGNDAMIFASGSNMSSNIAIGASTLTRNQVDSQIAIGANALQYATTGNANTAIGRLALQNTTTGIDNVAIGTNSLLSNITGERNIGIGKESLRNAATNVSYNTAIGYSSLYNVKSGNNVGIGHATFENLQSGSGNIAIGYTAGLDVTTGYYNTLIGANLRGQSNWSNVVAISDGQANIKFFNSGSQTTLTNNTLISGSLTTTGSATIGTVLQLTQLDPLPTGADGQMAVSASNLYFYSGSAWNKIAFG